MPNLISNLVQEQDIFLSEFRDLPKRLNRNEPAWLRQLREKAIQRFGELGFPTTRQEEWRNTNVDFLSRIPFQHATAEESGAKASPQFDDLEKALWVEEKSIRLVFVNGYFSEGLSFLGQLPAGVTVGTLATALSAADRNIEGHFARYADYTHHPLVALNTAYWQDGAWLRIAKGTVIEEPIHVVFVSTTSGAPLISHPRILIVAEEESEATFTESYFGWGENVCFSNAVTEILVGERAVIDHYKLQVENEKSYHLSTLKIRQERNANFTSCSIAFGGRLTRNEVGVLLNAEGADCGLNGLYVVNGSQHVDNYTTVDHAQPHGTSNQFYKGIMDGHSTAVFNGRVIVRQDAQKTDAFQKNKNLLLSENAVIDTNPQLEIFANDVRCTHGATIGQIHPEEIFYLCSRGIGQKEARELLTYAFAGDIIDRVRVTSIRACLEGCLRSRLAQGNDSCLQEAP